MKDVVCLELIMKYNIKNDFLSLVNSPPIVVSPKTIFSSESTTDEHLIQLWLHNKRPSTKECYRSMIKHFRNYVNKPINQITLEDIYNFIDYLKASGYKPLSVADYTIPIKSLFSFAYNLGVLRVNIGSLVKKPKVKNELAERILLTEEVHRMIILEPNLRNKLILKVLYAGGLRASELCHLKWRDIQQCSDGCIQITVFGKGGKTRFVKMTAQLSRDLLNFRGDADLEAPVFRSKAKTNGGHLYRQSLGVIVQEAGHRAGIEKDVSPHFLRHSHASHALQRGASIQLVKETLGHSSIKTTELYLHVQPGESSGNYLRVFN